MFDFLQRMIQASWQKRLQDKLLACPFLVYAALVFFLAGLIHLIARLFINSFYFSLFFAFASAVIAVFLFAVRIYGKEEWLTGSWPIRTCIDLWKHDEDEE
ncbi:hypothetical protein [Brevibacillus massiliensis]|jgi:hypothetical protein|uniref:hypothetical protein n=1 Tax=Brevibacillus massiliensis TaxID=1118054 RepID=UPI000319FB1E|nr:hypothetical protein [Brevibacillus massiliensis]